MTNLFLICAGVGSFLLVIHLGLNFMGHDHDFGHAGHAGGGGDPHDMSGFFFGILSFRAMSAALAAFGLAGMAATTAHWNEAAAIGSGLLAAVAAIALVVLLMRLLHRMGVEGTVELSRAVDQVGTIYVPVPAKFGGQGKVQIDVMNRTMELAAVTPGPALVTGTRVRVVQLVDDQTAEVVSVGMG